MYMQNKIHKNEYSYACIYMRFLISFLVLVLNQLWILRGHFLCCRSLMKIQGTPYCSGVQGKQRKEEKVRSEQMQRKHFKALEHAARWSWKLTFSPQAWQGQREWSSWATWSLLLVWCLHPQLRLSFWPACCPPTSLQIITKDQVWVTEMSASCPCLTLTDMLIDTNWHLQTGKAWNEALAAAISHKPD